MHCPSKQCAHRTEPLVELEKVIIRWQTLYRDLQRFYCNGCHKPISILTGVRTRAEYRGYLAEQEEKQKQVAKIIEQQVREKHLEDITPIIK